MKITYPTTATRDASAIRCTLPIRYDDDLEELKGFPGLAGKTLVLTLDLDTGKVCDWPAGVARSVHLKVVDEGAYELLDTMHNVIVKRDDCYVPGCVPGEYGDYFIANIDGDGRVENWRTSAKEVVEDFWPEGS